jgi:hypothetical protein
VGLSRPASCEDSDRRSDASRVWGSPSKWREPVDCSPNRVGFETDTATDRTRRAGFRSCEEIAGDDLWRRYLSGEPHPNAWVTRIATAIV